MKNQSLLHNRRFPIRLYLMRHGETNANKSRIVQGWDDSELSENGRKKVERTSNFLKDEGIRFIFSSDLKRARETANIVAEFLKLPYALHPGLREQNFGDYEGKPYPVLFRDMKRAKKSFDTFVPDNGEPGAEFKKRIFMCMDQIIEETDGQSLLLITHGGTIQIILKEIINDEYSFVKHKASFQNSAVTVIHNEDNELRLAKVINANYLD